MIKDPMGVMDKSLSVRVSVLEDILIKAKIIDRDMLEAMFLVRFKEWILEREKIMAGQETNGRNTE